MQQLKRIIIQGSLLGVLAVYSTGCAAFGRVANPFYDSPAPVAYQGEANDNAISGGKKRIDSARTALEQMASYQSQLAPSPNKPVMNPAIVRLMWIPDHLNRNGDLIPAHYYYLKVKSDSFAVTDASELEGQLKGPGGAQNTSDIPYVLESERMR
jgi:hypothetical protein